ncbi:MAG: hypothetical protein ACLTS6_22100 [Anaerobutyricum sp.]
MAATGFFGGSRLLVVAGVLVDVGFLVAVGVAGGASVVVCVLLWALCPEC